MVWVLSSEVIETYGSKDVNHIQQCTHAALRFSIFKFNSVLTSVDDEFFIHVLFLLSKNTKIR